MTSLDIGINCIAVGDGAVTELGVSYQFAFTANGRTYRTIMTDNEYQVMYAVVLRIIESAATQEKPL